MKTFCTFKWLPTRFNHYFVFKNSPEKKLTSSKVGQLEGGKNELPATTEEIVNDRKKQAGDFIREHSGGVGIGGFGKAATSALNNFRPDKDRAKKPSLKELLESEEQERLRKSE